MRLYTAPYNLPALSAPRGGETGQAIHRAGVPDGLSALYSDVVMGKPITRNDP
jgi:hypothetical protein